MKKIFILTLLLTSFLAEATVTPGFTCRRNAGVEPVGDNAEETQEVREDNTCPESYTRSRVTAEERAEERANSSIANRCKNELRTARTLWRNANTIELLATAKRALAETSDCRALEVASASLGNPQMGTNDSSRTVDGIAECRMKAGYTSDWESCNSTKNIYNSIKTLETLMMTTQGIRNQNNQQSIQARANSQVVSGDGQNAIFDASLADNQFKKNLNQEQIMAYSAAIAALGSKIATWKNKGAIQSGCTPARLAPGGVTPAALNTRYTGTVSTGTTAAPLPNPNANDADFLPVILDCSSVAESAVQASRREVIANDDAKTAFTTAMVGFLAKVAAAKAAMDALNRNSAAVAAAKDATATPDGGATFEKCVVTPLDPACVQTTGRVAGQAFTQGDFSVGDAGGSNSFDLGSGTDETGATSSSAGSGAGNGDVAGITSPFGDDATKANSILDPSAAASITPTGGGGGSGGGAGGGLGGGGGASLGNDLQGEDKGDKASDIKANKLAGNYNGSGGKGFSAIAGSKEENPFASLFDSKTQGGLEEDRSIASDNSGVDSGLFQKISRRYNQVQQEKRIEAGGLE